MNERIRELALQAGYKPLGTFADELMEIYNKKFAKLIVQECCKMMMDLEVKYPANLTVREIKKNFGVEE